MNILSPFTREFWIVDDDVRKSVGPLPARDAVNQAHYSATALEQEREALRADLLRRLRINEEQRGRLNAALDELDALRILETRS